MYGFTDDGSIPNLDKLTASICQHEGLRLKAYTDTTGNLTIGYGRNLTNGITIEEAKYLVGNDIRSAILEAEKEDWWPAVKDDDVRARALVEMVFNLGLGKLRTFVHALGFLRDSNFHDAAAEFLDSEWARQVGERSVIICGMISSGTDVS